MQSPGVRLYVILAKDAPSAVVFRRAGSRLFATMGWNLQNDSFQMGQWLKGMIHVSASSLSPDGKFLLYEASTYKNPDYGKACYTAISYAPYLHALDFYFHNSLEAFGGFFIDKRSAYMPISKTGKRYSENRHLSNLNLCTETNWQPSELQQIFGYYFVHGLSGSGWREVLHFDRSVSWQKTLPHGWTLEKYPVWHEEITADEANRILDVDGKMLWGGDEWEWADYDVPRQRVLFARSGKIFSLPLEGLLKVQFLHDFTDMKYAPIKAPYQV